MITLGITGSMGAGKSTIAGMLRDMLVPVFDADQAVHDCLGAGGHAVASISHFFPEAVCHDADNHAFIDRRIIGAALADDEKIQTLEDILHPLVFQAAEQFKQKSLQHGAWLAAFDIPLLFETAADAFFEIVLCVSADDAVRRERVLARPGMTPQRFDQIMARQMPDDEKRRRAHLVLETHHSLPETQRRLAMMVADIRNGQVPRPASS